MLYFQISSFGTLMPPIPVLKSGDFNASYKFWWFQRLLNCTIIIIKVRFWRFFTDVFVVAFWWSVMFWWLINDRASSWVLASFATTLLLKLLHPHHVTVCALILFLFERLATWSFFWLMYTQGCNAASIKWPQKPRLKRCLSKVESLYSNDISFSR